MKIKKIVSILAAATLAVSAVPTVVSAESVWGNAPAVQTISKPKITVDFLMLGYSENKDGELTITGCYDYDPLFKCSGGYICVCIFNGDLSVPSSIDGKPVVGIKNMSGNNKIDKVIIPESVKDIDVTAYHGCNLVTERTDEELSLMTLYC